MEHNWINECSKLKFLSTWILISILKIIHYVEEDKNTRPTMRQIVEML